MLGYYVRQDVWLSHTFNICLTQGSIDFLRRKTHSNSLYSILKTSNGIFLPGSKWPRTSRPRSREHRQRLQLQRPLPFLVSIFTDILK